MPAAYPPNNNALLHIALYPRDLLDERGNPTYHWAFNLSPSPSTTPASISASTKYDISTTINMRTGATGWKYREIPLLDDVSQIPLFRVTIAEIKDAEKLIEIFRHCEIREGDKKFHCGIWVREAVARAGKAGCLGRKVCHMDMIYERGVEYAAEKRAVGRFEEGNDGDGEWDRRVPATWNMMDWREDVP